MSQEWFVSTDLAGIHGLPATKSGVIRRAKAENWRSRPRQGRGGGREYHVSSLPKETQTFLLRVAVAEETKTMLPKPISGAVALALHETSTALAPRPDATGLSLVEPQSIGDLADWQRRIMQARLHILAIIDELTVSRGQTAAVRGFIESAMAGELPDETMQAIRTANARGNEQRTMNESTVYRWLVQRVAGAIHLAPKAARVAALPEWMPMLLPLYQVPQKPSVAECVRDYWPKAYPGTPAPALRSAQRHLQSLPIEVREWGRMGRNARRAIQPFIRRTMDGLWPMDIVTVDGHLFKAYVRHPMTGRRMRPEVTTYLDIATRRAVGFSAWIAESSYAIWGAIRSMVTDPACGIPAIHYSDNGAYRADQHKALLARIGTTPMFAEAYRAQARGVIERFNSSVWVPLARTIDTYCGDDCDAEYLKKALKKADDGGENLPGWEDFCRLAQEALADYNAKEHSTLPRHQCPDVAWEAAIGEGWQPTLLDGDDLHDLLPTMTRKVQRAEINLPWGRYYDNALRAWSGQEVRVGVVPTDGSRVWVSDSRGRLIVIAERARNARPYVAETKMDHARAQREAGRVDRLERKLALVREEGAFQIEQLPSTALDLELHARVVAELMPEAGAEADGGAAVPAALPPAATPGAADTASLAKVASITDERKVHAHWLRVRERIQAGYLVSDQERRMLEIYWASDQAKSMEEFFESFGLVAGDFGSGN